MLKTADVECQWKLLTDWTRGSPYSSDSEKRERSADWSMSSPHSNHYASWMLSADWSEGSPHSCHSKRYLQEPKIKQTISARPQLIGSLSVSSNSRIIQNIILLNAVYCHVKRGRRRPSVNEYEINLTRSHFHRLVDRRFFFQPMWRHSHRSANTWNMKMTERIWTHECYRVCPSLFCKHDKLNGALLEVRETLYILSSNSFCLCV